MTNRLQKISAALGATGIVTAALAAGIFADPVRAQQPPPAVDSPVAAPAAAGAPGAKPAMLSLTEIERRVTDTGVRVTEIEVQDLIVEVEGRDSSQREVELVVDRRSGEILSRKVDD